MRILREVAVLGLVMAIGVVAAPAVGEAEVETCAGETVTIAVGPDVPRSRRVFGTGERDVIVVTGDLVVAVMAGAGDDLVCVRGPATEQRGIVLFAGSGDDTVLNESTLEGTTPYGTFTVHAELGDGEDTFVGGPENEYVLGGDEFSPDVAADVVRTNDGYDVVESGLAEHPNPDRVETGDGRDRVILSGTTTPGSLVHGGPKRDVIQPRTRLTGSNIFFRFPEGDAVVDNRAGTLTIAGAEWSRWADFESLDLTELRMRSVTVLGTDAVERVFLSPRSTYDVDLFGGDDHLASFGRILPEGRYDGGSGRDLLVLVAGWRAEVDLGAGRFESWSARRHAVARATGFENLILGSRSARVVASDADNRLWVYGRARAVVDGLAGDDVIRIRTYDGTRMIARGGAGDDVLIGSRTDDVLIGGSGRDEADGRNGIDRCAAEVAVDCEP